MSTQKLSVTVKPEDAIKVLKAYDQSEYCWDLTSQRHAVSNQIKLQVVQDGMHDPVFIFLNPDGTWELKVETTVDGSAE
jgi:hypothetical protein